MHFSLKTWKNQVYGKVCEIYLLIPILRKERERKNDSLRVGFEPTREYPIGFQVQRLNHSAIAALYITTNFTFIYILNAIMDSLTYMYYTCMHADFVTSYCKKTCNISSLDTSNKANRSTGTFVRSCQHYNHCLHCISLRRGEKGTFVH